MEEDIKISKEDIEHIKGLLRHINQRGYGMYITKSDNKIIENILNRLEQDERVIEKMAKELRTRQYNCYGKSKETIINEFRKKCEQYE